MILLFSACVSKQAKVYSESDVEGWHTIDLGSFQLEAPKQFKYKPIQGIDSFVGEIKGDGVTFFFDYGWYSSANPFTPFEYARNNKRQIFDDKILDALKKSGVTGVTKKEVYEKLKINKVAKKNKKECTNCEYLATLKFEGNLVEVPFTSTRSDLDNEGALYDIQMSEQDSTFRKIYWTNDLSTNTTAGIYYEDLRAKDYSSDKLSFRTLDCKASNIELIKKILNTVQLK